MALARGVPCQCKFTYAPLLSQSIFRRPNTHTGAYIGSHFGTITSQSRKQYPAYWDVRYRFQDEANTVIDAFIQRNLFILGDYNDIWGCVVIGLAGDLRYNGVDQTSKLIVRELVPHNLRYG